jgi:hypothetical protein
VWAWDLAPDMSADHPLVRMATMITRLTRARLTDTMGRTGSRTASSSAPVPGTTDMVGDVATTGAASTDEQAGATVAATMADAASIVALRQCMERSVEGSTAPQFVVEAASTVGVDFTVAADADKSALAS